MSRQTQEALLLEVIMCEVRPRVKELVAYSERQTEISFAELEQKAWELSRGLLASAVSKVLAWRRGDAEQGARCPQCRGKPVSKGTQRRSQETLVGRVSWGRSYYYCHHCRHGFYPLDEAWGIGAGQFSGGVQQEVSRLAARIPFEPAAQDFERLTGVSVSAREVERLAEERGTALEEYLKTETAQVLQGEAVSLYPGESGKDGPWGVALDAGKVHLRDGWHDVDVGAVFRPTVHANQQGERVMHCEAPSYVAQITSMEETGRRLYVEACKRGFDASKERVGCLGDGAPANWKQFALHFAQRVEILDWYHAVEHLWAVGQALYGEGTPPTATWVDTQKEALWNGRPHEVLQVLSALAEEPGGQAAADEIHYFATNQARMAYDRYRAEGYPIGSGSAESACKQVVGARLKQAGMRWSHVGAQAILNLRAALLGGFWDQAWQHTCRVHHLA